MPPPRTPRTMVRVQAAGQIRKQVQSFTYLGVTVTQTLDMSVEIARRTRVCWMRIRPLSDYRTRNSGSIFRIFTTPIGSSVAVPSWKIPNRMSYFFLQTKALFCSYLSGYLRQRSTFRDQLVVPSVLRMLVLNVCHDIPALAVTLLSKRRSIKFVTDTGGP